MLRVHLPPWLGRALAWLGIVAALAVFVLAWIHANDIRGDLLVPRPFDRGPVLEVLSVGGGRIVLPRTATTERDGVWGVMGPEAYGQIGDVIRIGTDDVERTLRTLDGQFGAGDGVRLDVDAFPTDPEVAHGIGTEDINSPGDLGPQPTWLIEGRRDTWVVFAHGEGTDRRTQALRMIPSLVEQGYPIVVATYRNDAHAPRSPDGLRRWGLEEWHDLDAALVTADRKGAEDFVIYGFDLGAEVVSMFLHESEFAGRVRAVILDSPVLDLERYVDDHSTFPPQPIAAIGGQLAAIRFGIEWKYLDQIARADEFDVPMLVLHGAQDQVVPFASSQEFADLRPDIVQLARFEQGGHGDLWNIDSTRYESIVSNFLLQMVGPE